MPSTTVARNASVAVAADEPQPRAHAQVWELPQAQTIAPRTESADDLGAARGIFTAVVAGVVIWAAIAWGVASLVSKLTG